MDFRFLYNRTKYFIISPVKAWEVVHRENRPINDVRGSFFLPLVILVSVSSFFGSMFFINTTLKPMYSVLVMRKYIPLSLFRSVHFSLHCKGNHQGP